MECWSRLNATAQDLVAIKKELATIKKQLKKDLVANKKQLATIKKQLKKEAKTLATPVVYMG